MHRHCQIEYDAKQQYTPEKGDITRLDNKDVNRFQGIVGTLLYVGHEVNYKLLAALSAIGTQQATAIENTERDSNQLLDYVATYPNSGIIYRASIMILSAHSNARYLKKSKTRSRAGVYIFLSEGDPASKLNGPILTITQIIKAVMYSATKVKLTSLFITANKMMPFRYTC